MSVTSIGAEFYENAPPWVTSARGSVRLFARRSLIRNLGADSEGVPPFNPEGKRRERILERLRPLSSLLGVERRPLDPANEHELELWAERLFFPTLPAGAELYLDPDEEHLLLLGGHDHLVYSRVGRRRLDEDSDFAKPLAAGLKVIGGLAENDTFGILTSSPRLCGGGEVVEVALHLPAAAIAGQLKVLSQGCAELGFWLTPQSPAGGGVYLITNLTAQGYEPGELAARAEELADRLTEVELRIRRELFAERRLWLEDRLGRAWGTLGNAGYLREGEGAALVSWLRMGRLFKELEGPYKKLTLKALNRCLWLLQPTLSHGAAALSGQHLEGWQAELIAGLKG